MSPRPKNAPKARLTLWAPRRPNLSCTSFRPNAFSAGVVRARGASTLRPQAGHVDGDVVRGLRHLGVEVRQLQGDAPVLQLLEQDLGAVVGLLLRGAAVGQAQPGPGQLDLAVEDVEVADADVGPPVLAVLGAGAGGHGGGHAAG